MKNSGIGTKEILVYLAPTESYFREPQWIPQKKLGK